MGTSLLLLWFWLGGLIACHPNVPDQVTAIRIGKVIARQHFDDRLVDEPGLKFYAHLVEPPLQDDGHVARNIREHIIRSFIRPAAELLFGGERWIVTTRPPGPLPFWIRNDITISMSTDAGCIVEVGIM
jgi:hypothetical protein